MQRKTTMFLIALLPLVSGCMSQSDVQVEYADQQEECRDQVAHLLVQASGAAGVSAVQQNVGQQFSDCMKKRGWNVGAPKTGQTASADTPPPPSGAPSTHPSAAATTAAPVASTPAPATAQSAPVASYYPPTGAPSTAPSAATGVATRTVPQATMQAPAAYQPARTLSSGAVPYGQGAGRQF